MAPGVGYCRAQNRRGLSPLKSPRGTIIRPETSGNMVPNSNRTATPSVAPSASTILASSASAAEARRCSQSKRGQSRRTTPPKGQQSSCCCKTMLPPVRSRDDWDGDWDGSKTWRFTFGDTRRQTPLRSLAGSLFHTSSRKSCLASPRFFFVAFDAASLALSASRRMADVVGR